MDLRCHRIPHSTNVDRIALAAGLKGLTVEWVDHDAADRSALVALSGQPLVPVVELDDAVLIDSPAILRAIDARWPTPPLWPPDPATAALADVCVEWFNDVWKRPPNRIADGDPQPDDAERLEGWAHRFDAWLSDDRPFLLGDVVTIVDVVVWPFVRYFGEPLAEGDDDGFHGVLAALPAGDHLRAWSARVAALPRA